MKQNENQMNNKPWITEEEQLIRKEINEENRRFKLYGLTLSDYKKLDEESKNICPICKNKTKLVIDHSHSTGKVRGLICSQCNSGLGYLKDSRELLLNAIQYLEKNDT